MREALDSMSSVSSQLDYIQMRPTQRLKKSAIHEAYCSLFRNLECFR